MHSAVLEHFTPPPGLNSLSTHPTIYYTGKVTGGLHSETLIEYWINRIIDLNCSWRSTVDYLNKPASGSAADCEDRYLSSIYQNWGNNESSDAGFSAVQHLDAAVHHMMGLQALIANGILSIAPTTLTRSVVENTTHAIWILDPDICPETRVARFWLSQFEGAWYYKDALGKRKDKESKSAKALREQIRTEIEHRFSAVQLPGKKSKIDWKEAYIGDARPATWSAKSSRMTELIQENGSAPHGLYDALSVSVHPNPVVLATLTKAQNNRNNPEFVGINQQWENEAQTVTELLYWAGTTVCNFFGLSATHFESWADHYKNRDGNAEQFK